MPTGGSVNGSRINGSRAYVDNQSTFIIGEGSNLTVGKSENTGAIIGKEGTNSTFRINEYTGQDIHNHDNLNTTGGSIGLQAGKNPITGVGVNLENRNKEGISRNTVIGDVEIGSSTGSPINRDRTKANETLRATHSSTNVYVEGQTIEYATNPGKFKEDLGKAEQEIKDVTTAIKESIKDRGDDNRNFFGQLSETRLSETINNIAGERFERSRTQKEVSEAYVDALKDLGYKTQIIYSDPSKSPQLIDKYGNPKAGTAFVKDGIHTIIINTQAEENQTRSGLIGTIAEEGSHIIGKVEGRQRKTGTDEKGLESTGRATNAYFQDKYKGNDIAMELKSDGKDYSNVDFGENVGDTGGACLGGPLLKSCLEYNKQFVEKVNKVDKQKALRSISFIVDFTPLGEYKGIIEGITGRDLLTKEEISLLSRVLGLLPILKVGYKGAKVGFKLIKNAGKTELLMADGSKLLLKSDEVNKFLKGVKGAGNNADEISGVVKNTGKNIKEFTSGIDNIKPEVKIEVGSVNGKVMTKKCWKTKCPR